jgi:soluble lytic murein transglycosylase-like protein
MMTPMNSLRYCAPFAKTFKALPFVALMGVPMWKTHAPFVHPVCMPSVTTTIPAVASYMCAPSTPFETYIQRAAQENGLDPRLVRAVISAESQYHVFEVSPAGACGLMQLMPQTARLFKVKNIFDPEENIRAGCKHLRYLLARFSNNLPKSLAAYNAGELPVIRYKGVPPFPETQQYVRRVIRLYQTS